VSFDLYLERLVSGESAEVDKAAVLEQLRRHCPDPGDKWGVYDVRFSDGSHVEFAAKGLESGDQKFTGCAFHLRGFTPPILEFVLDIAKAGDMCMFNAQGRDSPASPVAIVISEAQICHLPKAASSNPVHCTSAAHLAALLGGDHQEWESFRDRAIGKME
jgi:hypothetical protein